MSQATESLAIRIAEWMKNCNSVDLVEIGQLVFGDTDVDVVTIQKEENFVIAK